MSGRIPFSFEGEVWKYTGQPAWHFISLPGEMSKEIRQMLGPEEEGWGRLKATAKTGNSEWQSAIWFDSKLNTYLLPIKAEIRKREKIGAGDRIAVKIWL